MAASLPHPQRKCFVCHTEIVRTNYALLSIANKDITESKRNKIIIEKFLFVSVKRDQTNYLCKSCARIVDNIKNNVSKLQAIYQSDTTQQENVANTPRKGVGKGKGWEEDGRLLSSHHLHQLAAATNAKVKPVAVPDQKREQPCPFNSLHVHTYCSKFNLTIVCYPRFCRGEFWPAISGWLRW